MEKFGVKLAIWSIEELAKENKFVFETNNNMVTKVTNRILSTSINFRFLGVDVAAFRAISSVQAKVESGTEFSLQTFLGNKFELYCLTQRLLNTLSYLFLDNFGFFKNWGYFRQEISDSLMIRKEFSYTDGINEMFYVLSNPEQALARLRTLEEKLNAAQ